MAQTVVLDERKTKPRHFPALAGGGLWTVQHPAASGQLEQPLPPPLQLVWNFLPAKWCATALQPWQPEWELCAVMPGGVAQAVHSLCVLLMGTWRRFRILHCR